MKGVTIGGYHTYQAWGLMMRGQPYISTAKPKLNLVKVPGTNVIIDLTESVAGTVTYEPKQIEMSFQAFATSANREALRSTIANAINGQRTEICFDDDPDFYHVGRITVGDLEVVNAAVVNITISATVDPHKYERNGDGRRL